MGIGNPNFKGFLAACPNCRKSIKPICEHVSCQCSDWDESDWYTLDQYDNYKLELDEEIGEE